MCPIADLPPGTVKIVNAGQVSVGVYNIDGQLFALEDRCSHDDGPLAEGDWEPDAAVVVCPRHGARFDIPSARALALQANEAVQTFPVRIDEGIVKVPV